MNKKKTHEEFMIQFEQTEVKNRIKILGTYINAKTKIKCQCLKNPEHIFEKHPNHILNNQGCPFCAKNNSGIVSKKWSQEEFDVKLLEKNPTIKRAENYINIKTKILFYCKECNNYFRRMPEVVLKGTPCPICKDKISFNNKLLHIILANSGLEKYDMEISFKWSNNKRYDGYFLYENNGILEKILIEAQGEQHYRESTMCKKSLKEIQEEDKEKYELAIKNGYKILYLNCYVDNHAQLLIEYFNVLNPFLNLSYEYYKDCLKKAENSLIVQVCRLYEKNKNISIKQISEVFEISPTSVTRYLKVGTEIGICNYQVFRNRNTNSKIKMPVKAFNLDGSFIEEFNSIAECSRWFLQNKNKKILASSITEVCRGKRKTAGGYIFKYKEGN